ncbi:putative Peroxidase 48 [Telopea speciosissima]|uniref:putative Peroxidase 48 n=1 Tax=Telopea speciosissima TaxID=54955 RepID=UPI001CC56812|nr:putative Peroxidase 48 [Telopea speciosissima]
MWYLSKTFAFIVFMVAVFCVSKTTDQPLSQQHTRQSPNLRYGFYREKCEQAEHIVLSTMRELTAENSDTPAALLRLLFHDCFIRGCDASILLKDHANNAGRSETEAAPNLTLKGFEMIDVIKQRLENECPATVSCSDILVLAARDGITLVRTFFTVFVSETFFQQHTMYGSLDFVDELVFE